MLKVPKITMNLLECWCVSKFGFKGHAQNLSRVMASDHNNSGCNTSPQGQKPKQKYSNPICQSHYE